MGGTGSTLARPFSSGSMRPACIPRSTPRRSPTSPPTSWPRTGETVTYRQLDEQSNRIAQLFRTLGLQGRRPYRAVPGEQRALLRDLLGRAALGPDLHRHQLAADRGRGRLHRRRLRREALHHVAAISPTRPPNWRRCCRACAPLHDRRHDRRLRILGGNDRALARDADRRRDRRPRHALFVGHHRPAQGRAAGASSRSRSTTTTRCCHHAQALRHGREHDLSLAGAALSRGSAALQHDASCGSAARR